jgi:hypothetical protein
MMFRKRLAALFEIDERPVRFSQAQSKSAMSLFPGPSGIQCLLCELLHTESAKHMPKLWGRGRSVMKPHNSGRCPNPPLAARDAAGDC